ncbi:CaiB/BaiF CoA transferase family protein [Brucella haematophila]|uniref:CaiB/BaiF CoA transferase family protein n=1 Tax=Brucella haematophila TaxID=419474 RepID=UPI001485DA4F|nr:CaiB/BaiF CoA-transferase family protein [Brucella haematophila]
MASPLKGLRILDTTAYISGPYASALLGALGAEVVKIEPPKGEAFRRGIGTGSKYFRQYNVGKRSVVINLKKPEGVALIKQMVPQFDVFMENSRPGKMEAMGLGREALLALNPRLVYSSVSGFGDGGPFRDRAAYDSIGQSMSGFYSIMNDESNARLSGTCVADLMTAVVSAMGILASLVGRDTGAGAGTRVVETSLLEAMSVLTVDAVVQHFDEDIVPTRSSRHPQAQNFCLATASGGSITLHMSSSEKFWQALARAIGREDLISRPEFARFPNRIDNYIQLKTLMETEFLKRSRAEWEAILAAADVPFAPVLTIAEAIYHPQTEWLDLLETPRDGQSFVRPPWRFGGARPHIPGAAPEIGDGTTEVLREWLSDAQLQDYLARGVVESATEKLAEPV